MPFLKLLYVVSALFFSLLLLDVNTSVAQDSDDFDEKKVPLIKKGETTQAEIIKLFGKPSSITEATSTYISILVYVYVYMNYGEVDKKHPYKSKSLDVYFDEHGVVERVYFSTTR